MLEVRNIYLSFNRPVLNGIDFSLKQGKIIGIAGRSGAGKSSLLRIMAGLADPDLGEVLFDGQKVKGPSVRLVPGHPEIQLVDQGFKLDDFHTVEENIREKALYLPYKERDQLVNELLELMELDELRAQQARSLSGGEQQRLALARALACEPKVLLLDEPFAHLDARLRSKLTNWFLELRKVRGTSIVLVSHDGSEMLGFADLVLHLKKGTIVRKAKPEQFYYRPSSMEEARLFGAVNAVLLNNKRILFRPDEYELNGGEGELIRVRFEHSLFTGPVYENYFSTERGEKLVLYSFNSMDHVGSFRIRKRYAPAIK